MIQTVVTDLCPFPLKFIFWSPNPRYLRISLFLEIKTLKRWLSYSEALKVCPIPIWWCLYKKTCGWEKRPQGCSWIKERIREDTARKWPSTSQRRGASEAMEPVHTFILDFYPLDCEKINVYCSSQPVLGI